MRCGTSRSSTRILAVAAGWTAFFAFGAEATAQQPITATVAPGLQRLSFEDAEAVGIRSIMLASVPIAVGAPLAAGIRFDLTGAWARGSVERADGQTETINGLTDTSFSLGWTTPGGGFSLSAIAVASTGASGFTDGESELAGLIAADLFPFRLSNWGSGGGFGGGFSAARVSGPWGFGAQGSFLSTRVFEPFAAPDFHYRPGDRWSGQVAVDRRVGTSSRGSLTVTWIGSDFDQVNGEDVLEPGTRIQVMNAWAFPVGVTASGLFYGAWLHRSGALLSAANETRPDQGFLILGAGLRQPMGRGVFVPTGDVRLLRRDDGEGQGWLAGIGVAYEARSGGTTWIPSATLRRGSITIVEGSTTAVTGVDVGLAARFGSLRR